MNEYDIKRLALVLAIQAEIEGMKAENQLCAVRNYEPAFDFSRFQHKSYELQELAYKPNEQL